MPKAITFLPVRTVDVLPGAGRKCLLCFVPWNYYWNKNH
jgi:hypothetical protein